jgi:hypothetical protein
MGVLAPSRWANLGWSTHFYEGECLVRILLTGPQEALQAVRNRR